MPRFFLVGFLLTWAAGASAQQPAPQTLLLVSATDLLARPDAAPLSANPLPLYEAAGRTRGQAWTYSLVGTLVPVGAGAVLIAADPTSGDGDVVIGSLLVGSGFLVGPSLGHFYLGDGRRAWIGLGIRAAGVGLGLVAGAATTGDGDQLVDAYAGATVAFLVAAVGYAVGTTYSFATLNRSARERGLVVVPTVRPDGTPGLALTARF